ncbi:MAG TPA: helix-turn-helix domain-containing protein [Anaeromyxobacter sp.]|nr:helix-turn-helix domain-containing protein [Anaeromyxobacter sp.]
MKPLADQTLYEILEVSTGATPAEIAEAVERARALYGPGSLATYTLMSSEEAALLTRRIDEAQSTLLDPAARARYDEQVSAGAPPPGAPGGEEPPAAAGWPSPPPVIPALVVERAEASQPPPDPAPAVRAPPPPPADVPPARPAPILLSREVVDPPLVAAAAPPSPAPAATPIPLATRAAPTPVPTDDTAWTGEVLRRLREARGITVQQLSERTKVTRHHIENIEADRYGALPAPVYLRGILLAVARELRLDGQKVARSYLERAGSSGGAGGTPRAR